MVGMRRTKENSKLVAKIETVNGMEKWVKVNRQGGIKDRHSRRGARTKIKSRRGISLIVAGESSTHHRTELILPESKHSLTV